MCLQSIWLSMLANCLLVELLLYQCFDYEKVEELGLLVVGLVVGVFFQLESLSARTILGPETDETVRVGWRVWVGNLKDD